MKDLQEFINNIIDIFTTKKSLPKDVLNDFIKYFYFCFFRDNFKIFFCAGNIKIFHLKPQFLFSLIKYANTNL